MLSIHTSNLEFCYPTRHHVTRSIHSGTDGEFQSDHSVTIKQNVPATCTGSSHLRQAGWTLAFGRVRSTRRLSVTSAPRIPQNSVSGHVIKNSPRSQNH